MARCIWVVGTPRSLSNYVGGYLHRCGIPAWLHAPTNAPNQWNQIWAEDPKLSAIMHAILDTHPQLGLPQAAMPNAANPGFVSLREYLARRGIEQPGDFAIKSNWLPFVAQTVLDALPGREHVLLRCSRPKPLAVNSLATLMPSVSRSVITSYINACSTATDSLVASFTLAVRPALTFDAEAVKTNVKTAWNGINTALQVVPTKEAEDLFDPAQVRN